MDHIHGILLFRLCTDKSACWSLLFCTRPVFRTARRQSPLHMYSLSPNTWDSLSGTYSHEGRYGFVTALCILKLSLSLYPAACCVPPAWERICAWIRQGKATFCWYGNFCFYLKIAVFYCPFYLYHSVWRFCFTLCMGEPAADNRQWLCFRRQADHRYRINYIAVSACSSWIRAQSIRFRLFSRLCSAHRCRAPSRSQKLA